MKVRLKDEINRDDLDSQIESKILEATEYYRRMSFFAHDKQTDYTLTSGDIAAKTYVFQLPAGYLSMRFVEYIQASTSTKWPVDPHPGGLIGVEEDNAYFGQATSAWPQYWAPYSPSVPPSVALSPVPGIVSDKLRWHFLFSPTAPVNPTDGDAVNEDGYFWMTECEAMVRYTARARLVASELKSPEAAEAYFALAKQEFNSLYSKTIAIVTTGESAPDYEYV